MERKERVGGTSPSLRNFLDPPLTLNRRKSFKRDNGARLHADCSATIIMIAGIAIRRLCTIHQLYAHANVDLASFGPLHRCRNIPPPANQQPTYYKATSHIKNAVRYNYEGLANELKSAVMLQSGPKMQARKA